MNVGREHDHVVWEDKQLRFDVKARHLSLRGGELLIDSMNAIEDIKGNNGQRGEMIITNLRVIWTSSSSKYTNLSIGLGCITSLSITEAVSRIQGRAQALHILTKYNFTKFEFVFTFLVKGSPRLFTTLRSVHRAYLSSKLYRDLKLRGAIISNHNLIQLPQEELVEKRVGVWNLSHDQGSLGNIILTNIRFVWYSTLAENFNVSAPYIQIASMEYK
eukprot:GHVR01177891.1.p1 GENE.GHVR01177891.1~~GHVR01177891.1.p1  ORF type:complete len:228 (+),score=26.88 GHVR01177891.1:34-684(+)